MIDRNRKNSNVSSILKKISIQIPIAEDREEIENAAPIVHYDFAVKVIDEKKEGGFLKRTYYLFTNGFLIDAAYVVIENDNAQAEHLSDVQYYLESEFLLSAMRAFEFAVTSADLKTSKQKKLSRQYYKVRNETAAKHDAVRRNVKAGIKSGRPLGSKKTEPDIPKRQLYKMLSDFIKSYYSEQGELPTQELAAQSMGFSYAKKLERLLDTYQESRSWRTLANDLLRGK